MSHKIRVPTLAPRTRSNQHSNRMNLACHENIERGGIENLTISKFRKYPQIGEVSARYSPRGISDALPVAID